MCCKIEDFMRLETVMFVNFILLLRHVCFETQSHFSLLGLGHWDLDTDWKACELDYSKLTLTILNATRYNKMKCL